LRLFKIKSDILILNFVERSEISVAPPLSSALCSAMHTEIPGNLRARFAHHLLVCIFMFADRRRRYARDHGVCLSKSTNRVHPANFP